MNKWLDLEILKWSPHSTGGPIFEHENWRRPYELCTYAESLLKDNPSPDTRANVIRDLRKAIDLRVKMIFERYALQKLPIKEKPSDPLELLEFFGIVRPMMLQQLIDIRNSVEHDDEAPPDLKDCRVFLELVWYFLKSTDGLVRIVSDGILCENHPDNLRYWVQITFNFPNCSIISTNGWVPPSLLSDNDDSNKLCLKIERLDTVRQRLDALGKTGKRARQTHIKSLGGGENEEDICFVGEVRGSSKSLTHLFKRYFDLY